MSDRPRICECLVRRIDNSIGENPGILLDVNGGKRPNSGSNQVRLFPIQRKDRRPVRLEAERQLQPGEWAARAVTCCPGSGGFVGRWWSRVLVGASENNGIGITVHLEEDDNWSSSLDSVEREATTTTPILRRRNASRIPIDHHPQSRSAMRHGMITLFDTYIPPVHLVSNGSGSTRFRGKRRVQSHLRSWRLREPALAAAPVWVCQKRACPEIGEAAAFSPHRLVPT